MLFVFSRKSIQGFGYDHNKYCGEFAHVKKVNCCGCFISLLYLRYQRYGRNQTQSTSMAKNQMFRHTLHKLYLTILPYQSFLFQLNAHATINHSNNISKNVHTLHPQAKLSQTPYENVLLTITTATRTKRHIFSSPFPRITTRQYLLHNAHKMTLAFSRT